MLFRLAFFASLLHFALLLVQLISVKETPNNKKASIRILLFEKNVFIFMNMNLSHFNGTLLTHLFYLFCISFTFGSCTGTGKLEG